MRWRRTELVHECDVEYMSFCKKKIAIIPDKLKRVDVELPRRFYIHYLVGMYIVEDLT